MSGFVIIVDIRLRAGTRSEFRQLIDANSRSSVRLESGCRRFDVVEPIGEAQHGLDGEQIRVRSPEQLAHQALQPGRRVLGRERAEADLDGARAVAVSVELGRHVPGGRRAARGEGRVIEEGAARPGDMLERVESGHEGWNVARVFAKLYDPTHRPDPTELVAMAAAGQGRSHIGRVGALSELAAIFDELEAGKYVGRAVVTDLGA